MDAREEAERDAQVQEGAAVTELAAATDVFDEMTDQVDPILQDLDHEDVTLPAEQRRRAVGVPPSWG